MGAVGRLQLAPALALRAELDDHFYSFSGTTPPDYSLGVVAGNYHSSPQHDLVVSLGLAVTPLGRGKSAP